MSKQKVYAALDYARSALHPILRQEFRGIEYTSDEFNYPARCFQGLTETMKLSFLYLNTDGTVTYERVNL